MRETRHLEEIHEEDVEVVPQQVFTTAKKTTTARTTGDRASWSTREDKAIVSSYINAGGDIERNTNTRKVGLWNDIVKYYEEARQENPNEIRERSQKSMQLRWDHINSTISRWVDIYRYELRHKKSGDSTLNVENRAYPAFQKAHKNKSYQLMHCFEIMRTFPKWNPEIFHLPSKSEGSNKNSCPNTPYEKGMGATPTRPEGIKKTKRKGKEAAISSFLEVSTRRIDLGERMLNMIKERGEERRKQKEDATKMRMLSVLMDKPMLGDVEAEMYRKLREEFNNKFL